MNTVVEMTAAEAKMVAGTPVAGPRRMSGMVTEALSSPDHPEAIIHPTGIVELDRVLGGGLPEGATVLVGGEPGIGKSTLLAQACSGLSRAEPGAAVLYITAEESLTQVRARFRRLELPDAGLELAQCSQVEAIVVAISSGKYRAVVVDSVQMISRSETGAATAGSASECRVVTALLVEAAKQGRTALVLIGHVTKDGQLAGPRLLEHLVDTVLSFEGDRYQELRTLRAVKNRFGATNEMGIFAMSRLGLVEVPNPSALFIEGRDPDAAGSVVVPALEGSRCLLVEVQALIVPTEAPQPQRKVSGLDINRVAMVLAVLAKRLHLPVLRADVFVNVTGGARILEPAADLGIALAIASSLRDKPVPQDLVALGEVGLGGELRSAARYELRATEARRLGFQRLLGPGPGSGRGRIKTQSLAEALRAALGE
jgi:DNA repair protein RadA/Sms